MKSWMIQAKLKLKPSEKQIHFNWRPPFIILDNQTNPTDLARNIVVLI